MLEVKKLAFAYGATEVFRDISLQIGAGKLCALFGPNGSGKTTLFKCCLNFLVPKSGEVWIGGQHTRLLKVSEMAKLVAYVPQEHKAPFPYSVKEVVLMGRNPHLNGLFSSRSQEWAKVMEALERLGITGLADKPYNELSGGQRQLVLIARALAQDTQLLLLDEPASSLDFKNQLLIWEVLRKIAGQGRSVLVCTHDPNHVLWFCEQAIVLGNGRCIAQGAPKQALAPAVLEQIYGRICLVQETNGLPVVVPASLPELGY